MKKCGVIFTSWITCIASRLGMLENVILTYIPVPRRIIGYNFFKQAHILKTKDNKIYMVYKNFDNEYDLPNRELGLYTVESFVFDLQTGRVSVGRSPSAHFAGTQRPSYHGADCTRQGPTYTAIIGFDQPQPSYQTTQPCTHHSAWEGYTSYQEGESSSRRGQWEQGNTYFSHETEYERGRASFSTHPRTDFSTGGPFAFHAPPEDDHYQPPEQHRRPSSYGGAPPFDLFGQQLTSLGEGQQRIQTTHTVAWQHQMDNRVNTLQQSHDQGQEALALLFQSLGLEYPPLPPE